MLLCQQTHKTHYLVAVEPTFIPKLTDCMHKTTKTYLEREHSILLSVTSKLYIYQVYHGVGRCVKHGSCSFSPLDTSMYPMTSPEMFFSMKFFADLYFSLLYQAGINRRGHVSTDEQKTS